MNERIKLLADQAGLYASEQYPGSFVKYDPKWFEFYNKKFAELIIQEVDDLFKVEWGDENLTGNDVGYVLKKHFGVKE